MKYAFEGKLHNINVSQKSNQWLLLNLIKKINAIYNPYACKDHQGIIHNFENIQESLRMLNYLFL